MKKVESKANDYANAVYLCVSEVWNWTRDSMLLQYLSTSDSHKINEKTVM